MQILHLALLALLVFPFIQSASAQTIIVNSTTPCFLNYTAGPWLWRDCGYGEDYLEAILLPWEWISGGYFTMIIVGIFMTFSYIKYHKIVYPMITALFFLPVSYFLFPTIFLNWALVLMAIGMGALAWYVFVRQTREY